MKQRVKQRVAPVLGDLPGTGESTDGETSDETLMLDYASGNSTAFEMLYARHKGPLYRYMLRGCRSEAIARDLFQDVWVKLIQARHGYEPDARFNTWLYSIAHNHLVDHYRRSRPMVDLPEETAIPVRDEPDAQASRKQGADRLLAAIGRLPFEQREAILLREERGLSLDAIAEVTGVGRETVKSRLRYALAKLREGLADVAT